MATELLRNPTNIGDIFFSGSQSVAKGDAVTWIFDDVWAFKATEKCAVSTNATPFVNLSIGQTFIVYKRTQQDIDEGNSKGIYIFDRDTIVALAYPQEVTQDIVIENDIYNNNLSTIIVESDKSPVVNIITSHTSATVGDTITLATTSYSPDDPPSDLFYQWIINGVQVSTAETYQIVAQAQGSFDVVLLVTDAAGRKGNSQIVIAINALPVIEDYISTGGGNSYDNATTGVKALVSSIQLTSADAEGLVEFKV